MAVFASGKGFIMGANSNAHDSSSGRGIVKSGIGLERLGDFASTRKKLIEAISIIPSNVSEENIRTFAKTAGSMKAQNAVYQEESKQRLAVAKECLNELGIGLNHLNGAAQINQQFAQTVSNGLQRLELTQLKTGVIEETHEGFANKLNTAAKLVAF